MMRVVADENIPYVAEAFAGFGEVRVMPAHAQTREAVAEADILLVRSVTKVDAALVDGTKLRFVATATIGTDHIDLPALAARGIGFASAPGSNAVSVAEWVVAALLAWSARSGTPLAEKTLGVVGAGNVGSRVIPRALALGMRVFACDPPRARAGETDPLSGEFPPLGEMLPRCDFVTVHVPLIHDGPDRTANMAGAAFFDAMKEGAVFLNSSRGGVVDEAALRAALASGRLAGAGLDVWRGEPAISAETLAAAYLATPHIAGYSFDGKVAGTAMIHEAARRHFGHAAAWSPGALLPAPVVGRVVWPEALSHEAGTADANGNAAPASDKAPAFREARAREAVRQFYDILADDARLRKALAMSPGDAARWFTRLRKEYPVRREFRFTRVDARKAARWPSPSASETLRAALAGLGFAAEP